MSQIQERSRFSNERIKALKEQIEKRLPQINGKEDLCIYITGSFGRSEACENSDIDIFFLTSETRISRIDKILLDSELIKICREMGFPEFSKDGAFLEIHCLTEMLEHLGSTNDDYKNFFTARMLLLLESKPLYNEKVYKKCLQKVIQSYFRDYHDHETAFLPVFIVNDIVRYWKTLCLNYEHKRNRNDPGEASKSKAHLKNLKLKFSRMNTCYSAIIWIFGAESPMSPEYISQMINVPPIERIESILQRKNLEDLITRIKGHYEYFLEITRKSEGDQIKWISIKENRNQAFERGRDFSNSIFDALKETNLSLLKYLVV